MYVRLQVDNQFGEDGPQANAFGQAYELRKIDDEYWAYVKFWGHEGVHICKLEQLLIPNTFGTETYHSTLRPDYEPQS